KTARALGTFFQFVGEVRQAEDLEHADFLLNDSHPKAAQALDLLLGVQGWRRFLEQDPNEFRKRGSPEAERVLVIYGASNRDVRTTLIARQQEINTEFSPKIKDLNDRLSVAVDEKIKV